MRAFFIVAFLMASLLTTRSVGAQEVLTNESVVEMVKAGLSERVIIAKIRNSPTKFDTQTDALIALKKNGVPEKVIDLPQPEVQSPVVRPKRKPVRPVEIKFGSVKKHIRYATEIPVAIANWLIEQGKELPITANFIHPSEAGFSQSATTKKLKSGQYMRVGHNQEALLHKARELLDGCGHEGLQIKVLLDNGITLSA